MCFLSGVRVLTSGVGQGWWAHVGLGDKGVERRVGVSDGSMLGAGRLGQVNT